MQPAAWFRLGWRASCADPRRGSRTMRPAAWFRLALRDSWSQGRVLMSLFHCPAVILIADHASLLPDLVLNDGSRRDNVTLWKGGASAPPPPGAQRVGPLGPEATFLQGLKPPMTSRFPWRG
ncbi:hypothetical protein SBA2_560006 [Acidobacteriia bacterium SbA2]|nr:hypothetical protein SBA2_560006 [Acidobacteriia bacterium SbA2]